MSRNSTFDLLQRLYRWETRSIVTSKSGYTQKFGVTKVTQSKYDCIFIFACLKVRIFIHDFPPYLSVILLFGRNNTVSFTTQTAVIRGTLLALDYMRKDRGGNGGTIVNVSSMAGNHGAVLQHAIYICSKTTPCFYLSRVYDICNLPKHNKFIVIISIWNHFLQAETIISCHVLSTFKIAIPPYIWSNKKLKYTIKVV